MNCVARSVVAVVALSVGNEVFAKAPARAGQPYSEASLCDRADVIMCEDFDYPQNFSCTAMSGSSAYTSNWQNPGLSTGGPFGFTYCAAADFP